MNYLYQMLIVVISLCSTGIMQSTLHEIADESDDVVTLHRDKKPDPALAVGYNRPRADQSSSSWPNSSRTFNPDYHTVEQWSHASFSQCNYQEGSRLLNLAAHIALTSAQNKGASDPQAAIYYYQEASRILNNVPPVWIAPAYQATIAYKKDIAYGWLMWLSKNRSNPQ